MITKARFENFKTLKDVEMDFERLTVIVGPNGCGKTSVLEGLEIHYKVGNTVPKDVFTGKWSIGNILSKSKGEDFTSQPGKVLYFQVWTGEHHNIELDLYFESENRKKPFNFNGLEPILTKNSGNGFQYSSRKFPSDKQEWLEPIEQISYYSGIWRLRALKLHPNRLAAPSYISKELIIVDDDGYGLPSFLAELKLNSDANFNSLVDSIRAVIPELESIKLVPAQVNRDEVETISINNQQMAHTVSRTYMGRKMLVSMKNAPELSAESLSEGTLIVIGLLSVLLGEKYIKVLLVDDIDRGLHPRAHENLILQIRKIMEMFPDLQIIATTHSPYLLNYLKPEEIRLMTLKDDGTAAVGKLTDHPEFDEWKEIMLPGEFWSAVAEDWIVNKEPQSNES